MASSSSFSSSDDETRNDKGSRKRRKAHGGDKRRGSQREDNHRKSNSEKNERRNQFHRDNNRPQRKRRLENTPPRREDPPARHREEEPAPRRVREESNSNQNRQRDGRDRRQNKSSFEQAKVKKEPSPDWGRPSQKNVKTEEKPNPQDKEKPNFGLSGKLTEDTNTVNGVVVKYSEPEDARKPKRRWRLYQFKGEKNLPTLHISRQSGYLIGRDRKVADLPIDHPSCSKQHAAFQFRLVPYTRENGTRGQRVRPYLIDLESANGTFVNGVKLEARRYHELLERDVIKFGFSSREYVLLHEQSKDEDLDDDVPTA